MVSRRFALPLSALSLLTLAAAPAAAQTKVPAAPPADASQPAVPDLMPLKQALAPLAGNGLLEVQVSFLRTATLAGAKIPFRKNVHILARHDGSFRAELYAIDSDGKPEPKFLIVSDGKHVWTYRPGQRAYSVETFEAFKDAGEGFAVLGLVVNDFFLGDLHFMPVFLGTITQENKDAMMKRLKDSKVIFTSKSQSTGGVDYTVYRMGSQKSDLSFLFYVDARTNTLKKFETAFTVNETPITNQEILTTLRVPASVPPGTFTWTPPPGVKKEAGIKVDSF